MKWFWLFPACCNHFLIVLFVQLSLNANGKNIKYVIKVGKNEGLLIMSVIDLYLLRKGMTELNYEFCLSTAQATVELLISEFIACIVFMCELIHTRKNFRSLSSTNL
jgi:hypothetical protein